MIFGELFRMALSAIWTNKLRSALTLVGIIAGVASIIGVMTGISVIQSTIEGELSVLGSTVFQVQKWASGGPMSREEWLKIMRRRPTTTEHADAIREKVSTVTLVGSELWSYRHVVKYRDIATNPNVIICGGTPEYPPNNTHYIGYGRNISAEDVKFGRRVAVLGYAIAKKLFPWTDPVNKVVRVDGRKFTVVGVFEEKISSMGGGFDNYLLMPITEFKQIYGMRDNRWRDQPRSVRAERGLKHNEEDDFTIFTNDSQIKAFNNTTAGIKTGAFVIGIVALIVAGIGIMNIMLVSVTERTREIGIRKSLGAKKKNILIHFLLEAIILSNIGGAIGVVIGFALGNLVSVFTDFAVNIPMNWAVIGLAFCTAVGLIFGLWPAYKAAGLNPVESLRFE
jgi:putative ABC transport system permease protein